MAGKLQTTPRWGYEEPPDYQDIIDGINFHKDTNESTVYKYKKNWEGFTQGVAPDRLFRLEAIASQITRQTGNMVFAVDLAMILWARDLEYFSRSYLVHSLKFLSHMRQYPFFRRNLKNGFLKRVSLKRVGLRTQDVFYLSGKGIDVAKKTYEKLIEED